jgi:carnitine-CoA ligase
VYIPEFKDISERHLGKAIALQAEHNGDTIFIMFDETRYTFAQTNEKVNELAQGLKQAGVGVGDRVAFFMSSCPEVLFLVLAVNKLGAVWVPVNTDYKGVWLQDTIERSRPKILVTDTAHAERLAEVQQDIPGIQLVALGNSLDLNGAIDFESLFIAGADEPDMSEFGYGDTCAVLWTSGTTGKSKGVMQSHNVWFNSCMSATNQYETGDGDVIFCVLPMYNSAAWVTSLFRALLVGVPLAIDTSFSVSNFWERVKYYGATQIFTLGAMHMFLWNAPEKPDDADNSLNKIMAVPMPTDIVQPFSERFNVQVLGQGMSQSEAMMIVNQAKGSPDQWPAGSCGSPTDLVEVKLMDDDGNEVGIGEHGECWVKPTQPFAIFNGYFDSPDATAAAYEGDWYKTGDLLKRDENNVFYFVDRKKDAVRFKGRNISTFEVELVTRQHPAVLDCAAFGIPSETLESENEIKMDIILREGHSPSEEEIARFINDNAPYFFVPRYVEFVKELPYTPTNKIQKYKLREAGVTANTWDGDKEGFKATR